MGATTEVNFCYEPDVAKAFRHLVDEALYDHGHSGYSGTIAEANGYAIYDNVIRLQGDAEKFAWHLANEVAQKWEAALAIPFVSDTRSVKVTIPEYYHPYDYEKVQQAMIDAALPVVRQRRLLRRGEKVIRVEVHSYSYDERPFSHYGTSRPINQRRTNVQTTVHIQRAASALTPEAIRNMQPDGWYFGGCYSC